MFLVLRRESQPGGRSYRRGTRAFGGVVTVSVRYKVVSLRYFSVYIPMIVKMIAYLAEKSKVKAVASLDEIVKMYKESRLYYKTMVIDASSSMFHRAVVYNRAYHEGGLDTLAKTRADTAQVDSLPNAVDVE